MGLAYWLGASPLFIYLSGLFAVVGHVLPFYLRLKGARGVATATGLLLAYLIILIKNGWLSLTYFLALAVYTVFLLLIFHKGSWLGVLIPPALYGAILFSKPPLYLSIFSGLVVLHIFLVNGVDVWREKFS